MAVSCGIFVLFQLLTPDVCISFADSVHGVLHCEPSSRALRCMPSVTSPVGHATEPCRSEVADQIRPADVSSYVVLRHAAGDEGPADRGCARSLCCPLVSDSQTTALAPCAQIAGRPTLLPMGEQLPVAMKEAPTIPLMQVLAACRGSQTLEGGSGHPTPSNPAWLLRGGHAVGLRAAGAAVLCNKCADAVLLMRRTLRGGRHSLAAWMCCGGPHSPWDRRTAQWLACTSGSSRSPTTRCRFGR
jgi:hypothetical protein